MRLKRRRKRCFRGKFDLYLMISRRQSTRKALIVSSAKLTSKDSKTRKPHVMIATFTAYSSEIEATQVYYSFFFFLLYEFNYTLNNSYFSLRLKKKKTIILVNPQRTTNLCCIVKFLWTTIIIISLESMNALRIFLPIEIWSSISLTTFELMVIWWLALSLRISDLSSWPNMLFNAWLPITKSKHYPLLTHSPLVSLTCIYTVIQLGHEPWIYSTLTKQMNPS